MTSLDNKRGTIAHVLTNHSKEIYSLIEQNKLAAAKTLCLELLDSKELIKNPATEKAKTILQKSNGSKFLTILVTYMSGLKVN